MQSHRLLSFSSVTFVAAGSFHPNVAEVSSYLIPTGFCEKYCLDKGKSLKMSSLNVVLVTRHLKNL